MICTKCNHEITTLKKQISTWTIIAWIIFLCIPVIGWILLIIDVAIYIGSSPNRCPLCNQKV